MSIIGSYLEWWEEFHYRLNHPPGYTFYREGKPIRPDPKNCPFCHPELIEEW